MIRSRIRWTGHVARIEEKCFSGKARKKAHWEGLNVGGRIILKWILER
jgi:hypothetical protein